jgi:peptide/nickel transport system ATP-binding protein
MRVAAERSDHRPVTAEPTVLEVADLHVTFPGSPAVRAVRGVSLSIDEGEIVGLVGESGSGKTVLGLAALGLLPRVRGMEIRGEVRLGGLDMAAAPEPQRRARRGVYVGAVFQDPMAALNPAMKIGRQVAEAAGTDEPDAIHTLLADAGIPAPADRAGQYPHELSGGLRQRVTIAMAVARSPRLVVADEPTTALDVTVQARVLTLLARLRERGMSVLLVTHDLAVAASICDRIAVAYAGRIVECGPTAALTGAPAHPYTVGLLASRPTMGGPAGRPLAALPGRMPDPRMVPSGCAFAPRCPLADPRCDHPPAVVNVTGARTAECHRPAELAAWPEPERVPATDAAASAHPAPQPGAPERATEPPATRISGPAAAARAGASTPYALRMRDVVREFGGRSGRLRLGRARAPFRAVDGVSLELEHGSAVAVVGESGSGKTTLLRMAVGLLAPTGGTIERGPGAAPQLIFQDAGASLTPWLTVGQMLGERLTRTGVRDRREARIAAILEAVGLPAEVAQARPRELSGGQRQRAAIARAVIVPPALLACDEPVSALDVSLAAQVLNLLGDLRRQLGLTLLFVTHDLAVAGAVAEEVVVMTQGRVVERGETAQVLGTPREAYTRALLDAVPKLPGAVAAA